MATVRPYEGRDKEEVREICLQTGPHNAHEPKQRAMLLACFCDYYIEKEPGNCFVLADEEDTAAGYILCAENFSRYKEAFNKEYIARARKGGLFNGVYAWFTTIPQHYYARKYPAHLHIDILPAYQRQGWGGVMMDTLTGHLRAKKIPAVMLVVNAGNKKGINFYKKYGFKVIRNIFGFVAMGLEI